MESEHVVFAVRRHVTVVAGAVSRYLVVLFVAFLCFWFADGSGTVAVVGLLVLLIGSLWFGWNVGAWWVETFTVTDRRVLLVSGLANRRVAVMPLRKVTDLTFERSLAGRLLGYGAFVLESAGQHQALSRVDFLPQPESLYLQMSDLLFGRAGVDDDPDEDGGPQTPRARSRPVVPVGPPAAGPAPRWARPPRPPTAPRRVPPPPRPDFPGPSSATTPLPSIAREPVARRPRGRHDPQQR